MEPEREVFGEMSADLGFYSDVDQDAGRIEIADVDDLRFLPLGFAYLPDVLVVLILAVIALTGLGLAGASTFTLLNAKNWDSNPIGWLVGFGVTLLSGVYFPPTVLPEWLIPNLAASSSTILSSPHSG